MANETSLLKNQLMAHKENEQKCNFATCFNRGRWNEKEIKIQIFFPQDFKPNILILGKESTLFWIFSSRSEAYLLVHSKPYPPNWTLLLMKVFILINISYSSALFLEIVKTRTLNRGPINADLLCYCNLIVRCWEHW